MPVAAPVLRPCPGWRNVCFPAARGPCVARESPDLSFAHAGAEVAMSSSLSSLLPSQAARRLADVSLFSGLSDDQRRTVVARASLVEMPLGGRIFSEGELSTQLYVLLSGEA